MWYKQTMLECGQIQNCWAKKIRKSVDIPPTLAELKQRQRVNFGGIINIITRYILKTAAFLLKTPNRFVPNILFKNSAEKRFWRDKYWRKKILIKNCILCAQTVPQKRTIFL